VSAVGKVRYPEVPLDAENAILVRCPFIFHDVPVVVFIPIEVHLVSISWLGGVEGSDNSLRDTIDLKGECCPRAPEVVVVPDPEIDVMGPVPYGGTGKLSFCSIIDVSLQGRSPLVSGN